MYYCWKVRALDDGGEVGDVKAFRGRERTEEAAASPPGCGRGRRSAKAGRAGG